MTTNPTRPNPRQQARDIQRDAGTRRCRCCGEEIDPADEPVLQRGAVTVAFDPIAVFWNRTPVPLSPTEASVYAFIARRGRITHADIDQYLAEIGASADTRALLLGHIRRKFVAMGACDPFQRINNLSLRLQVDADERGYSGPVIGVRAPRFARASAEASPVAR